LALTLSLSPTAPISPSSLSPIPPSSSRAAVGRAAGRLTGAITVPAATTPSSIPDAAKIRAFFVHPAWTRQGIGSRILALCEEAGRADGFTRFEMGATLTGVPLYRRHGYVEQERVELPLANGETLPIVRMTRSDE
jgi:GNAT superfamily N-acetyltransferase